MKKCDGSSELQVRSTEVLALTRGGGWVGTVIERERTGRIHVSSNLLKISQVINGHWDISI